MIVVDRLEIVQIDKNDADQQAATLGLGNGLLQTIQEQDAVGQIGQRVDVGQPIRFDYARRRRPGKRKYKAATIVRHGNRVQRQQLSVALFVGDLDLAAPLAQAMDDLPDLGQRDLVVLEHRPYQVDIVTGRFVRQVAGQFGKRAVDLADAEIRVGDGYGVVAATQQAGQQRWQSMGLRQIKRIGRQFFHGLSIDNQDAIGLDQRVARQAGDADGRAGRIGLAEVLGHDLVELGEVTEIGKVDIQLDHVGQAAAGGLGDRLEVLEYAVNLGLDALDHLHGGRVQADLPG